MPIYTYHCENCGHQFDKEQHFSDTPLIVCPQCKKHRLRKVYKPAGVVFKGSGFYVTDKRKSASKPRAKSKSSSTGNGKAEKPTETSKSETSSTSEAKKD